MGKPYKTYNQQLKILRSRNLGIRNPSKTLRVLEKENYYCVINGYKELFIDKGYIPPKGSDILEKYISNTDFEDIYNLYSFDKELKQLFLNTLINFENNMKSIISYYFSKETSKKGNAAYLDFNNYDSSKRSEALSLVSTLFSCFQKFGKKDRSIKHYLDNHDEVPLWVLVNILTFGNISALYFCCPKNIQSNISNHLLTDRKREYRNCNMTIYNDELELFLKAATHFRNLCAHDNRFYNAEYNYKDKADKKRRASLYSFLLSMQKFISKKDYDKLCKSIESLKNTYTDSFTYPSIMDDVYKQMGFKV